MAKKCYRLLTGEYPSGAVGNTVCSDGISFVQRFERFADLGYENYWLVIDGLISTRKVEGIQYEEISISSCSGCDNSNPNIPPETRFDCVNSGCVPTTTFGTPGKYASLADCQSGCAKDSPCTGECISSSDIAALQQAANKAQANCCK